MNIKGFRIDNKNLNAILLMLVIAFSDILGNGNLNLLYFMGIFLALIMAKEEKYWRDIALLFIPFSLIPVIFLFIHGGEFQIERVIVYSIKMFLNISLFSYFKHQMRSEAIYSEINIISICFMILMVFSVLTLKIDLLGLWRHNDIHNSVSKTRLQFFYSEPSVLGFLCCIFLTFLVYYILFYGMDRWKIRDFGVLSFVLILTFSISAIGYLAIVVGYMIVHILISNNNIKKKTLICICISLGMAVFILCTNNPIHNRLAVIASGNDASFYYRTDLSSGSLREVLSMTDFWGLGLSNMNTVSGLDILERTGIEGVYANSFMYFVAENGLLGLAYISWITVLSVISILRNRKNELPLKVALMIIWFISQVSGGYFTDPTEWILLGIINSNLEIKQIEKAGYRLSVYE